ncbi:MAG TPA: ABC transporter permease [Bryobacteraceae bacterium]|nr:ABC transporter permease [Bryobacteraceae bacterium]
MQVLWQDLRYASRVLWKAPGFTMAAVTVLAIGIGANSAIFSLVDAVLLRPLPFPHPQELVRLYEHPPGYAYNRVAPLNYADWSEQSHSFVSMAALSTASRALSTNNGVAESIPGESVTFTFFDLLGVKPVAGRTFVVEDAKPGTRVVVISERLWKSRFGGDPKLIGNTIPLDSRPFTVIGVVPADFQLQFKADVWTPFILNRSPDQRKPHYLVVLGRLKPGITIEQARADMTVVAEGIARVAPETNKGWGVTIDPLRQSLVQTELRATSLALAGVAGFVLLMACANVANLMLVRGAGRTREIAVRASLGGSQARIFVQLLTESMLLALTGGAVGIGLSWAIVRAAPALLPAGTLPVGLAMQLDLRVIGLAAAVTIITGLLFGLVPAFHARRIPLAEALRSGSRTSTEGMGAFRSILAAGEIAVAVMLVAGAGLLLRTLVSMYQVDPGYHAENVLTARVSLPLSRYPNQDRALTFYQAAEREISLVPGVRWVAFGGSLPLQGRDIGMGFYMVGDGVTPDAQQHAASYQIVGANYFDVLGIKMLRGRGFTDHDTSTTAQVCVVNEEFVRRYLKGRDPIGARVNVQSMGPTAPIPVVREIIGVVRQVKADGLAATEDSVEIYVPITQNPWYGASVLVRAAGDPGALASAVKAAIAHVDKDLPVTQVQTMEQVASASFAPPRFRAALVGTLAALAIVLAAVGIFGVLAFSVSQRTREFGVRMALGARTVDVVRLVLGGGLKIIAGGIVVGLAGAAVLTRSIGSLLFGVKPLDPVTFLAAPALLALIALVACSVPAMRAARVDPAVALRQE